MKLGKKHFYSDSSALGGMSLDLSLHNIIRQFHASSQTTPNMTDAPALLCFYSPSVAVIHSIRLNYNFLWLFLIFDD
jgi:hypothetical protein